MLIFSKCFGKDGHKGKSKTTLDLLEAYVGISDGTLSADARNKLDVLCRNITSNRRNWTEHHADKVLDDVEVETLRLIKAYLKYNSKQKLLPLPSYIQDAFFIHQIKAYNNFLSSHSPLFWYQKLILGLIVIATCVVCAVIGMTLGIVIGAAIAGGASSILPALGTAFGGIVGGGFGGMVGAIKGLTFGAALGAAIGFAVLGALGLVAGWLMGRKVLPKKPTGHDHLDEAMRNFSATLHPNYISTVIRTPSLLASAASAAPPPAKHEPASAPSSPTKGLKPLRLPPSLTIYVEGSHSGPLLDQSPLDSRTPRTPRAPLTPRTPLAPPQTPYPGGYLS